FGSDVEGKIEGRDMALLNELGRGVLYRHLIRRRNVIEVRVLGKGAEPVELHRSVRVANDAFGVSAVIKFAERAGTDRVIQFADRAPIRRQLKLEIITEQPCRSFGVRRVEL